MKSTSDIGDISLKDKLKQIIKHFAGTQVHFAEMLGKYYQHKGEKFINNQTYIKALPQSFGTMANFGSWRYAYQE